MTSQVRLVRSHPKSDEFSSTCSESYKVYKKYQMCIHREGEDECGKGTYNDFLVASPLEVIPILFLLQNNILQIQVIISHIKAF